MGREWKQTEFGKYERWEAPDGAVVKYDHTVECDTARPWLPHHRGYMAFAPGKSEYNYLKLIRRNSRLHIPRKFKTAKAAMKAVDKEYPPK